MSRPNELTEPLAQAFAIEPGWRHAWRFHARWSELDGFSHVSHRAHFVWYEEVRNNYLALHGFALVDANVPGPVIKETRCTYERALAFGDEVAVTARASWLGRTSFGMDYAIWKQGLVARGSAVIVWLQNSTGEKVTLPPSLREALIADGALPK